jgi:putative aldouronate transport system permease protein
LSNNIELRTTELRLTGKTPRIKKGGMWRGLVRNYQLYVFLVPTLLYFAIFHYGPMYGIQIAFKNFLASKGITGSPWVGFTHFERFFNSADFWTIIKNTISLSFYELIVGFPIPIILAIMLNQVANSRFKKWVQTITYAPHFISVTVIVGMLFILLSPRTGVMNTLLAWFGMDPIFFMGSEGWFKTIYVLSGVWQNAGWSTIIYLAALTAVNPDLHEAAVMDGANKLQRIVHIDIPSIMPTIMILLILQVGNLMTVGFEKVYLMQNALNIGSSQVIQTYVYEMGLLDAQYSYSAAIGLFNSVINFILLISINAFAKRMKQSSLW